MTEQWELKRAKAMCFAAGSQLEALEKAMDWLRPIEACVSLLVLRPSVSDDGGETITVFYEEY